MDKKLNISLTDEEIIDKLIGGNSQYFNILYERYRDKVTEKCHTLLKNRKQAEEFAEDIFSKVYERLSTFQGKSSFSTWLYSVTYNHCIDYLRLKKQLHYPKWNIEQAALEIPDEEVIKNNISYERLLPILELVHPEEKALLYMKYMDDLSLKQIGQALRISETAVKMRLKRARTRVLYLYNKQYID